MKKNKLSNSYQREFGRFYAKTPKSVFAAIVYSYTSSGGDNHGQGILNFLEEWRILHENGIVRQKPPRMQKEDWDGLGDARCNFCNGPMPCNCPPPSREKLEKLYEEDARMRDKVDL